jgi:hypothetical protein
MLTTGVKRVRNRRWSQMTRPGDAPAPELVIGIGVEADDGTFV